MVRSIAVAAAALLTVLPVANDAAESSRQQPAVTLDAIASSGHGLLFNAKFRRIKLGSAAILSLQADLLSKLKAEVPQPDPKTADYVKQVDAVLAKVAGDTASTIFLQAAKANRLLDASSAKFRAQYGWRNRAILGRARVLHPSSIKTISPDVLQLLINGGLVPAGPTDSDYVASCRKQGVPIPPDFVFKGKTAWQYQGRLTHNILGGTEFAGVWTYSDPATRGACVTLPRGSGRDPGSLAGIICQGALSGNACFWDNLLRSEGLMAARIPWRTRRLVINDLQDGSSLDPAQPCTRCHTGNNVFLISPDDPTWGKLLRGPLDGPRTGTFTTRLEASPGMSDPTGHYTPLNAFGWTNPLRPGGCAGSCHELPSVRSVQVMPPDCAHGAPDPSGCYGMP
jgi:hypothetical protein